MYIYYIYYIYLYIYIYIYLHLHAVIYLRDRIVLSSAITIFLITLMKN